MKSAKYAGLCAVPPVVGGAYGLETVGIPEKGAVAPLVIQGFEESDHAVIHQFAELMSNPVARQALMSIPAEQINDPRFQMAYEVIMDLENALKNDGVISYQEAGAAIARQASKFNLTSLVTGLVNKVKGK